MGSRDLEEDVYEFLQRVQLEQFFDKVHHRLHLTRLSHFDHVTEEDLTEINMSKPEQRRLFDALKKLKKRSVLSRLSFKKSKKKRSKSFGPTDSTSKIYPKREPVKSCLISETSVTLLEKLGDGEFGFVHRGEWSTSNAAKLSVAVKSLKFSNDEAFLKGQNDFKREASSMSGLDHENVIRLYGVVLSTSMMLVMELASLGSLLDRLHQEPDKFPISKLCDFVLQLASGMSYLESKRYIHRDVATRNLLLASYDKVKIGDFGLMRPLSVDEDIYVMNPLGKVPFAWCAPECLKNRQFSHASDVWAFGITVVEIFSYGTQPWAGLNASQILDMVDEPACGRPSQPDHCTSEIFSLLLGHCWAHKPSDRSKFSSIKEKLSKLLPEDVTILFDLEAGNNSEKLTAQAGDSITIITWKSRLGTKFAKAQNKRTLQVGYVPVDQINPSLVKRKDSASRPKPIIRMKDISPPVDNTFSHCAHRGDGKTPNWGQIMSSERQIVGKQIPLSLPTKLIPVKNTDELNETPVKKPASDAESIGGCSINDTSSLSLHGNSGYGSHGVLNVNTWSDSGYYGNWEICSSPDYEPMTGSNPIAIPFAGNQAFDRPQWTKSPLSYSSQQSTLDHEPTSPRWPSTTVSPESVSCHDQRSRPASACESFPIVMDNSEPRPPLPPKKRNLSVTKAETRNYGHDVIEVSQDADSAGGNSPYEYISDNIYEVVSAHRSPLIPGDPQIPRSSSLTLINFNGEVLSFTNNLAYRSLPDGNSGNERDSPPPLPSPLPPPLPPPRKGSVNRAFSGGGLGAFRRSACLMEDSRCSSMSAIDDRERFLGRERGRKANSFSCVGQRDRAMFMKGKSRLLDSISLEMKSQVSGEPTYENMEKRDVPVSGGFLRVPGTSNPELRPALPKKRQPVKRTCSEPSKNHTRNKPHRDDSRNPRDQSPPVAGPWILRNASSKSDRRTARAEDSENLPLDGRSNNPSAHAQMKNIERRGRASGCEDFWQFRESFREISSDYADLDAIWGKLRLRGKPKPSQSDSPSERSKLKNSFSDCQINAQRCASDEMIAAWKRHSVDQDMLSGCNSSTPQNGVGGPTLVGSSSSLRCDAAKKTDVLQIQLAHASMVTTV